jgi:hypothetical protein
MIIKRKINYYFFSLFNNEILLFVYILKSILIKMNYIEIFLLIFFFI